MSARIQDICGYQSCKFFLATIADLDRNALSDYIDKLAEEVEDIEKYLIDVVLAAKGSLQYADIGHMTSARVNVYVERIGAKNTADSGTKGKEFL
jgi:hypothetical protein